MKVVLRRDALIVDLGSDRRCLSSAVLRGGLGAIRTWLNLQVPPDYSRTDPDLHLMEASDGMAEPVVGMMTAADVSRFRESFFGSALAIATVGARHAIAAAGTRPCEAPRAGTINLLVVVDEPLTDAALVGALQTAVEAKAQALAAARVAALNASGFATGTATDSICIACLPGQEVAFAGPATRVGADIARAVHQAIYLGARSDVTEDVEEVSRGA